MVMSTCVTSDSEFFEAKLTTVLITSVLGKLLPTQCSGNNLLQKWIGRAFVCLFKVDRLVKEYAFLFSNYCLHWTDWCLRRTELWVRLLQITVAFIFAAGLCCLMVGCTSRSSLHLKFYSVGHSTMHQVTAQDEGTNGEHCCILLHTHASFSDTNPGLVPTFSQNAHTGT